jgi:hypothetical protein
MSVLLCVNAQNPISPGHAALWLRAKTMCDSVPIVVKIRLIRSYIEGNTTFDFYTLYAPPNHRDGIVHHTRAEAEADNEHFDGKTTG